MQERKEKYSGVQLHGMLRLLGKNVCMKQRRAAVVLQVRWRNDGLDAHTC